MEGSDFTWREVLEPYFEAKGLLHGEMSSRSKEFLALVYKYTSRLEDVAFLRTLIYRAMLKENKQQQGPVWFHRSAKLLSAASRLLQEKMPEEDNDRLRSLLASLKRAPLTDVEVKLVEVIYRLTKTMGGTIRLRELIKRRGE